MGPWRNHLSLGRARGVTGSRALPPLDIGSSTRAVCKDKISPCAFLSLRYRMDRKSFPASVGGMLTVPREAGLGEPGYLEHDLVSQSIEMLFRS